MIDIYPTDNRGRTEKGGSLKDGLSHRETMQSEWEKGKARPPVKVRVPHKKRGE